MASDPNTRVPVINRDTMIPIGVALALLTPLALGTGWLFRTLDSIDRRLERIEVDGKNAVMHDRFENWALRLSLSNPTIHVPPIDGDSR